jgi:hypothetical protein
MFEAPHAKTISPSSCPNERVSAAGTGGTIASAGGVASRARSPELPTQKGVCRAPVYSACRKGFGIAGMAAASLKFIMMIQCILRAQSFAPIGIWTESLECGLESLRRFV